MSVTAGAAAAGTVTAAPVTAVAGGPPAGPFEIGAAEIDITPPALDTAQGRALDAAGFVPRCGASEAQISQRWPGKRLFAFEDPYIDVTGAGQYVPGDPYCDADGSHRYQAPYIAGGSGQNRWPITSADTDPAFSPPGGATTYPAPGCSTTAPAPVASPCSSPDAIKAEAVVFSAGPRRIAMVSVDSIGIFDSTMDEIRADAEADHASGLAPGGIFISSTHDESAPDPIGLWGPGLSGGPSPLGGLNGALPAGTSSGVDNYYMRWMAARVADAVAQADTPAGGHGPLGTAGPQTGLQPAHLKAALARMPSNQQSCWSSYPFVDTGLMPVMQGVSSSGQVIFTLANVGTHDETLAFSGKPAYTSMLSGDWAGRLRESLEAGYPGSIGIEMAGLVGSVETPALYPEGTQVLQVPGAFHDVPGNPVDGCSSVYPEPRTSSGAAIAPYSDALSYVFADGKTVAGTAAAALGSTATSVVPTAINGQTRPVCLQLENNFFLAAFAAGLFPGRPAYADPGCTTGVQLSGPVSAGSGTTPAPPQPSTPVYLKSEVGVVTLGPVQIAYSPGEVFPVTEVGGYAGPQQMPFPTDCYQPSPADPSDPASGDYTCGVPLPMTPEVSAEMTAPLRFLAGLGEDMVGYLFPPGNFVGSRGETTEPPWSVYEETTGTGTDRFGYGHADDPESPGPHAGLAVTGALSSLLKAEGPGDTVRPGLFVDSSGRLCGSPFPESSHYDTGGAAGSWVTGCSGFTGAVGIRVVEPNGSAEDIDVGSATGASAWATYFGTADSGTAGTVYPYSTAARGVIAGGKALLIDVFTGARLLQR